MPSPIAHSTMGYAFYKIFQRRFPWLAGGRTGPLPFLLIAAVILSLLPDIDSVLGLLVGDFGRFHNNITHSLFVGLGVALVAGMVGSFGLRAGFREGFLITFFCYQLHVIMDFFTVGRGVMAFWPLSSERFSSPFKLFYGFHWSDGLLSVRHGVTLITELSFSLLLVLALFYWLSFSKKIQSQRVGESGSGTSGKT